MSGLPAGYKLDSLPPGYQVDHQPSGGIDLGGIAKKVGGAIEAGARNFGAARTAAARDPVGALANELGAAEGAVAGGVMAPMMQHTGNDIGRTIGAFGHGIVGGATNPDERSKYNGALGDMIFNGIRPQGESMPARIGRGVEDFGLQTAIDPVTHGGAAAMSGLLKGGKVVGGAAARTVKPLGKYVDDVKSAVNDPRLAPAMAKVAHVVSKATAPIRGGVDAGKDLLFLNPLPHGLGNMSTNNFLANGLDSTVKGLKYGVTGAPKATADELQHIGAGAWTPSLLDEPSPWGPVGWMNALGKKGVPAAVRGGAGAASGGAIANKTAPDTDTPQQRAMRVAEGSILGGLTGASPEVLNASNKLMSRLETGHRAAMLEGLPKPPPPPKPHFTAAQVAGILARKADPKKAGRASGLGTGGLFQTGMKEAPPDPRAAAINAVFGGGEKSPVAKIATSLGGPFAAWQADVVPRVVGGALKNAPARVEALARGQDITNRDVLKDKPYKLQVGGPVGGAAEAIFNTPKYASRLLGPLGSVDPNQTTNPDTFSLADKAKATAYGAVPGREVVGPFFGDTEFPSRAPAVPSATLNTLLGWYMKNRTPATDAILGIMRSTGLDRQKAAQVYERYKR